MINIKEITTGTRNGQTLWVCDFRYTDFGNKAARNLKPTKVLVRSNSETTKSIYYSNSHFVELNSKNEPIKSKVIAPFDNTGFRSFTGIPINVFETEHECREHFKKQCREAIIGLDTCRASMNESIDVKVQELQSYL